MQEAPAHFLRSLLSATSETLSIRRSAKIRRSLPALYAFSKFPEVKFHSSGSRVVEIRANFHSYGVNFPPWNLD